MRIAMVAAEVVPRGGGELTHALSFRLAEDLAARGHTIELFVPLHRGLGEKFAEVPAVDPVVCRMHDGYEEARLMRLERASPGVEIFAIAGDHYFDRVGLLGEGGLDYADGVRRFAYFCRAVLGSLGALGIEPDLFHCQDWPAALLPVYLRGGLLGRDSAQRGIDALREAVVVSAIGDVRRQGIFPAPTFAAAGVPRAAIAHLELEPGHQINLLCEGVRFADHVMLAAPPDRRARDTGDDVEEVLASRRDSTTRIWSNDESTRWTPECDPHLVAEYGPETLQRKRRCKADLLVEARIEAGLDTPVMVITAVPSDREQLRRLLSRLCERSLRVLVLDAEGFDTDRELAELPGRFGGQMAVVRNQEESFLRKVWAGADFALVRAATAESPGEAPVARAYGTIPIMVAHNGSGDPSAGIGFRVDGEGLPAILEAVDRTLEEFSSTAHWRELQKACMQRNESSCGVAAQYDDLYRRLLGPR